MSYYDSDCFWTHEELGRKQIEEDHRHHGLINWLKQLLVYVVDWEDTIITEANNQTGGHLQDHNTDHHSDKNSYRNLSN